MNERDTPRVGECNLSQLMDGIMNRIDDGQGDRTRRVQRVWLTVNGDIEREHTMGIYLREGKAGETLIVYVDSQALVQDFTVNRHLYLGRMAMAGVELADIQFRRSRYRRKKPAHDVPSADVRESEPPELDKALQERLERECEGLPPKLKDVVSEALSNMERYNSDEDTGN